MNTINNVAELEQIQGGLCRDLGDAVALAAIFFISPVAGVIVGVKHNCF